MGSSYRSRPGLRGELQVFCELCYFFAVCFFVFFFWLPWLQDGVEFEDSNAADARKNFWSCALRAVSCGTSGNLEKFMAFFELPEWWTYDPFRSACDVGIAVPAPCRTWRLKLFVQAL